MNARSLKHVSGRGCIAIAQGVQDAKFQSVQPGLFRQQVEQSFLPQRGLWHTKTAKGP